MPELLRTPEKPVFHDIPAWRLTKAQYRDVQALRWDYSRSNLPGRSVMERQAYLGRCSLRTARNLNPAVSVSRRSGQRYARQRWMAVTQGDVLQAAVRTEDNASASRYFPENGATVRNRITGNLLITGKLRVPTERFLPHRYRVIDEALEVVDSARSPEGAALLHIATTLAMGTARPDQAVRAYAFTEEALYTTFLSQGGLHVVKESAALVNAFDAPDEPAEVATWQAPRAQDVVDCLFTHEGVMEGFGHAQQRLRRF